MQKCSYSLPHFIIVRTFINRKKGHFFFAFLINLIDTNNFLSLSRSFFFSLFTLFSYFSLVDRFFSILSRYSLFLFLALSLSFFFYIHCNNETREKKKKRLDYSSEVFSLSNTNIFNAFIIKSNWSNAYSLEIIF